jgi:dihydroorotase
MARMRALLILLTAATAFAQADYDLLLKGGRVVDPKNKINAVRDVAIAGGKIAAVEANIPAARARRTVDVTGLYVTAGIIDIHTHVYTGTGERDSYAGDNSVYPDGFTLRLGVTTVADAGGSGWRNFEDFKNRVIDRSQTRVLAFLNIVGNGMRGGKFEQDLGDMEVKPTVEMAQKYKGLIVGIKSAHFAGPEWAPFERGEEAARIAGIPFMVDYGTKRPERPLYDLLNKVYRPGDIYTHTYSGMRGEQDPATGGPSQALVDARKRGVIFDVGHGGGSFLWRLAVPMVKAGFLPDTISTDLHIGSMNSGMKDYLNVMSKFVVLGMPLEEVILRSTWNPARVIQYEELGHLTVGAIADVAVLRLEKGNFGFLDSNSARLRGSQKLLCELTVKNGRTVYDLNGIARDDWDKLPANYGSQSDGPPRGAPQRKKQ